MKPLFSRPNLELMDMFSGQFRYGLRTGRGGGSGLCSLLSDSFGSWLGWLGLDRHLQLFRDLLILADVMGKVQLSIEDMTCPETLRAAFAHTTSTSGLSSPCSDFESQSEEEGTDNGYCKVHNLVPGTMVLNVQEVRSTGEGTNDNFQQWGTLAASVVPNMRACGMHLCLNVKRSQC